MRVYLDIRPMRLALNWSLRDLEKHSGVSKSMLSLYENGLAEPTITNYVKIAKALQVPINNVGNDLLKIHE